MFFKNKGVKRLPFLEKVLIEFMLYVSPSSSVPLGAVLIGREKTRLSPETEL